MTAARLRQAVAVHVAVLLLASPAWAGRLFVSNDGADNPACGTKAAPCRSLSQAIRNARDGDRVEVGPGRYGDLNGNGIFEEEGEEGASCGTWCMIHVDKRLTIVSRDGAEATVLDAVSRSVHGVLISASGARLGGRKRGFTIRAAVDGVRISSSAKEVTVDSNIALDNFDDGFDVSGDRHRIVRNFASGNAVGFSGRGAFNVFEANVAVRNMDGIGVSGEGHRLRGNVASGNWGGFSVIGSSSLLEGNLAVANRDGGFAIFGYAHQLEGNMAVADGREGFIVGGRATLRGNAVVGNAGPGVVVGREQSSTWFVGNNVFGNDTLSDAQPGNCGLLNQSGFEIRVAENYWGSATGPGPDPADEVCDVGDGSTTTFIPFKSKPLRIRARTPP